MTSHRLTLKLGLLGVGVVTACSLTVPSEDEVFGNGGGSSKAGSDTGAVSGSGNAANGGDPSVDGGAGNTSVAGGGQSMGGTGAKPGSGGEAGVIEMGGAGGEPPMPPEPTGELVNGSFEESFKGWTVEPATPAMFIQYGSGSGAPVMAIDGNWVLSGWSKQEPQKPYVTRVFQIIKGIEDGTYKLTAHVMSIGGINKADLYARNCGGTDPAPVPSLSTAWVELAIDEIEVTGGECEVGIDIDAKSSDWINVDSFTFEKVEPK